MHTGLSSRLLKIAVPLAAAIASWLIAGYTGYSAQYADHTARIIKLETQRTNDAEQMERIEKRLERLDEKIDVLLQREMRR